MSFPRYPKYKDSGVEWLGEVPEHWELSSLGRVSLDWCDGPFGSGLKSEHYVDAGVRVVRLQNIRQHGFDDSDQAYIDEAYYHRELNGGHDVREGDVLIAGLGDDRNTVGRACVAPGGIEPAMVKADCFRFRLDLRRESPHFVASQLTASSIADAGFFSSGSTRSRIPLSVMAGRRLALPPLAEQFQVVAFLDRETAKIDVLVAEQRRLMELLKEKRQAVTSHAVTKGLNPGAAMKPSGIEWLGTIPAHWEEVPLGVLCSVIQTGPFGSQLHSADYVENGTPVINPSNIRDGKLEPDLSCSISDENVERLAEHKLAIGDIVFGRRGEMGRCAVVSGEQAGWICGTGSLNVRLSTQADPEFTSTYLRTIYVREWLELASVGSTISNLNTRILSAVLVPVPPLNEQREISKHVRLATEQLDSLTAEAQRAIDLLQERRTALISAAVTGQIDVRNLV